jgi:hypothetical protein
MNPKTDNNRSRNVTPKDLIQAAFVVIVLFILGWYKETESKISALVFAVLPVIGLLYYLDSALHPMDPGKNRYPTGIGF